MDLASVRAALGLAKSILVYGMPWRQPSLRRHYQPFIQSDDLVFDIGAHVGDRTLAFLHLGARVVACEPQPLPLAYLRWRFQRYPGVTVLDSAVGEAVGTAQLAVSESNPTVSSVAAGWRETITQENAGFAGVRWNHQIEVPVTTLSQLISAYGKPAFCKIDVEGHEAAVLAGLDQPIAALSFEFVPGSLSVASACVDRLSQLGDYVFNISYGERRKLEFPQWVGNHGILRWLESADQQKKSGDIYAKQIERGAKD